jgi:hypothetical protein
MPLYEHRKLTGNVCGAAALVYVAGYLIQPAAGCEAVHDVCEAAPQGAPMTFAVSTAVSGVISSGMTNFYQPVYLPDPMADATIEVAALAGPLVTTLD